MLTKSVTELTEHLQDYENRGRRKNLRILEICEKAEGSDVVKFMEKWIPQILDMETKAGRVKPERAHHIPGPVTSRLPRAIIIRFHNFSDCQKVMEAARCKKEVLFEGAKTFFFQDFAAETLRRRQVFVDFKRKLQNIPGARYAMLYPASLRVTVNNTTKTFHTPYEVSAYIDSLEWP